MKTSLNALSLIILSALSALSAPVGICLHAYSPEAPREKIECFEFERAEKIHSGTRYFLPNGQSAVVTDYRNRGTILYPKPPQMAPGKVEELLKNYEEQAGGTPSVRPYLNPWILKLRQSKDQAARVEQSDAKLPTVTVANGISYTACSLKSIDGDVVSIRHRDGFGKVPLAELDAAEKTALAATNPDWSFDPPGTTPKDENGVFSKIVFRNGAQVINARFKEYAEGVLVFVADGRNRTFSPDLFPAELSVLGSDVEKAVALARSNEKPSEANSSIFGPQGDGVTGATAGYNDGSSILAQIKQVEIETTKALADLEQKLAAATKEHEALETEFASAGGKERMEQIRKETGQYRSFVVRRTLMDSGFEKLAANGESVYEVGFIDDGAIAIVVSAEKYGTGKRAGLYLKSTEWVDVKLTSGLTDKREVFLNSALDRENKEFGETYKKLQKSETALAGLEEQKSKMRNRAGLAIEALRVAADRLATIRPCKLVVSPKLMKRGFTASVQDRNFAAAIAALKNGDLVAIEGIIAANSPLARGTGELESLVHFKPESTTPLASPARIHGLFNAIESMKFRIGVITNDPQFDSRDRRMDACLVTVPRDYVASSQSADRKRLVAPENPFMKKSVDGPDSTPPKGVFGAGFRLPGEEDDSPGTSTSDFGNLPFKRNKDLKCENSTYGISESAADGKGGFASIEVFSHSTIAFTDQSQDAQNGPAFDSEFQKLERWLEQQDKSADQDFKAGKINETDANNRRNAARREYLGKLDSLIGRF